MTFSEGKTVKGGQNPPDSGNRPSPPQKVCDMTKTASDIRALMKHHPLEECDDPPRWHPVRIGLNTSLLCVEGPIVYARETTAAWLWENLASGTFYHEFTIEGGHKVAFDARVLAEVVRVCIADGKQVLIV